MIDRRPQGRAVLCGTVVASDALLLTWSDPAAQWGLGVFETIAVRDAAPRHFDDHVRRLNAAMREALNSPDLRNTYITQGNDPTPGSPDEFAALIRSEIAKWTRVVTDAGIKPEPQP